MLRPARAAGATRILPWLVGRGPSVGILSHLHAASAGDRSAIHDRWGSLTWRELDRRTNQLAGVLSGFGLRPGDRVATLLRNGREAAEAILAGQKLGVDVAPLNTWAKPKELAHAVGGLSPAVLIYDARHAEQLQGVGGPQHLLRAGHGGDPLPGSFAYEDLLAAQSAAPPAPFTLRRGRGRVIIHTSGTTGRAKAAARSPKSTGLGGLLSLMAVVPIRSDDVILCPAPLFHSFGLLTLTAGALAGASVILPERFDAEESLELIEELRATVAAVVPVMLRRILALPARARSGRDLSSLRIILASGSALSEDVRGAVAEQFGEVLHDLYGSTEAGWVAVATPADIRRDPRTLGHPVPGVEVAILDDEGRPMPAGEHGTIHVRSASTFEGYETGEDAAVRDGYLSMGDLGWLDDQGRLYVVGRADDMVVVGGENVYPAEVEEVIEDVQGVREAAVVGVPDEEYGQVLAAFVAGDTDPERILEACRSELASFKVPRRVEVLDELPRTGTGKVLKRELAGQG